MTSVYRTLERVLDNPTTVLIEGESGTGKDALAQWLHFNGPRRDSPFIKIDFASLPEDLVESELFGYERGAFTGAVNSKVGKLDLAQSGTAVLDEIAGIDLIVSASTKPSMPGIRKSRITRSYAAPSAAAVSAAPLLLWAWSRSTGLPFGPEPDYSGRKPLDLLADYPKAFNGIAYGRTECGRGGQRRRGADRYLDRRSAG